jgi:hypothetical protein
MNAYGRSEQYRKDVETLARLADELDEVRARIRGRQPQTANVVAAGRLAKAIECVNDAREQAEYLAETNAAKAECERDEEPAAAGVA